MQVSFIIPLYNCLPLTQAMLASLRATLPPSLAHEIIFVDDGSTDGTREWLQTLTAPPFRVLLNERNVGYAVANNRAATLAGGEFLVLLNNDLVLLPHWLAPMLAAHRRFGPRAGIVGNVQLDARTGAVDHAGIAINLRAKPEHVRTLPSLPSRLIRPIRPIPAVTGACLLIERALWSQLGGFDEAFVNGGEDVDLCYRARGAGRDTIVALRSVIRHHISSSPGRKARDEENSYRLARKWGDAFVADATRIWCRDYLARALIDPHADEFPLALHAIRHATGLTPTPPAESIAGLRTAQAREFAHWQKIPSR